MFEDYTWRFSDSVKNLWGSITGDYGVVGRHLSKHLGRNVTNYFMY